MNLQVRDKVGNQPIHAAARMGDMHMIELLLSRNSSEVRNYRGQTALHVAVENGQMEVIRCLIGLDKKLNTKDKEGNTLLHTACIHGHQELLELLVTRFPELINKKNESGYTPLHFAVEQGHPGIVEHLISKGAAAVNVNGLTPLDIAILSGQKEIALFLSSKPDFNSCSAENRIKLNEFQRTANSPSLAGRSSVTSNISSLLSPILSPSTFGVIEDDIGNLFGDNSNGKPLTRVSDEKISKLITVFREVDESTSMNPFDRQGNGSPAQNDESSVPNSNITANYPSLEDIDAVSDVYPISSPVVSSTFGSLSDINTSDITPMRTSDMSTSAWNEMLADVADLLDRPNSSLNGCNEIVQQSKKQRTC